MGRRPHILKKVLQQKPIEARIRFQPEFNPGFIFDTPIIGMAASHSLAYPVPETASGNPAGGKLD
ncbi:MAG: hypothetical protein AB1798_11225 [Spirochaetota bacterium]